MVRNPRCTPCFVTVTAMHLLGLNWQLQEMENPPAFENGAGQPRPTMQSVVTALSADSGKEDEDHRRPVV